MGACTGKPQTTSNVSRIRKPLSAATTPAPAPQRATPAAAASPAARPAVPAPDPAPEAPPQPRPSAEPSGNHAAPERPAVEPSAAPQQAHDAAERGACPAAPLRARSATDEAIANYAQLLDAADVEKPANARYYSYGEYHLDEDDQLEEEEEEADAVAALEKPGKPALLVVDRVTSDGGVGGGVSRMAVVNAWEKHDALVPLRAGLHRGWYPFMRLLLTDWDEATRRMGAVRLFSPGDLCDVTPADHSGAFGAVFTARTREDGYPVFIKGQPLNEQFAYELATSIYAYNLGVPIPAIIGMYRSGDKVFTVQAHSPGVPADKLFRRAEHRTSEALVRFAHIAAWILSVAHHHGVIHNDIALRNFLCGSGEHDGVQLVDFGLSAVMDLDDAATPTPYVHKIVPVLQCAPEVMKTGHMARAADVFQFGWMLVELFEDLPSSSSSSGGGGGGGEEKGFVSRRISPHVADSDSVIHALETERPEECPSACPEGVWELALRCLDVKPEARPTMAEVVTELEAHASALYHGLSKCSSFRTAAIWALYEKESLELLNMLLESCGCYFLDLNNLRRECLTEKHGQILGASLATNVMLTTLDLGKNHLGDAGIEAIASALETNSTLKTLHVQKNKFGPRGGKALASALCKNSSLRSLHAYSNKIGPEGGKAFAETLLHNSTLTVLDLGICKLGLDGTKPLLEALQGNSTLEFLAIAMNDATDEAAVALEHALKAPSSGLKRLSFGTNRITNVGAAHLAAAFASNTTLEVADLRNNEIGADGAAQIAKALCKNSSLRTLSLGGNTEVGCAGAAALAEMLAQNTALEELFLRRAGLDDDAVVTLAEAVATSTCLRLLYLQENHFGDCAAVALSSALRTNKTLERIVMYRNGVTDDGAMALLEAVQASKPPALTLIDVSDNDISEHGQHALQVTRNSVFRVSNQVRNQGQQPQ